MIRVRVFGVALVAIVASTACSGGGGGGSGARAAGDASSLETGVVAPPVPKDLVRTTSTVAGASTTTIPALAGSWVSPSGDDSAAGTQGAPWRTLKASTKKLKAGATLYVMAGTFDEVDSEVAWRIKNLNGSADKPVVIAAAPGARPKVVGGHWSTITIENSSYLEVRGLEVVGSATVDKLPTSGIEMHDSHHVKIVGNYIHDGGGGGVGANTSNHIDVIDNYISGMSKWNPFQTSGISLFESKNIGGAPGADGYSMRIIGNVVYGSENIALPVDGSKTVTDGNCIIVDTGDTHQYTGKTYIANNVCSNNGGRGLHVFQSGNVVAVNNTLYHNMQTEKLKDKGAELSVVAARNVVFRNNLVIPRADREATTTYNVDSISFETNLYENASGSAPGGTDRVVPDAGVANPSRGDFTLKPGSLAIDAGSVSDAPATDQSGKARRGKPDIGALEAAS